MKRIIILCGIVVCFAGCSMTIKATKDECTLSGFGGGSGSIEGKCTVEKGLIPLPDLKVQN